MHGDRHSLDGNALSFHLYSALSASDAASEVVGSGLPQNS